MEMRDQVLGNCARGCVLVGMNLCLQIEPPLSGLELRIIFGQIWPVTLRSTSDRTDALARRFELSRTLLLSWFRRRLGDPVEAEDLVQESFLRLAQRDPEEEVAHMEGYLYRTAASVLIDWARRRAVRHVGGHVPIDMAGDPANDDDVHMAVASRQVLADVAVVLAGLPERTRTVFVLRRMEGMRHKEIAVRLGISVSAVEKHVARAAEALAGHAEAWR